MNRLCFLSFLLHGRGFGGGVSGGCSRSLPDNLELSTKPSVKTSNHSRMSRNLLSDAVYRTRSPEAELLLVSAEPSAGTEKNFVFGNSWCKKLHKTVRFARIVLTFLNKFRDWLSSHSYEYPCSWQSFPKLIRLENL